METMKMYEQKFNEILELRKQRAKIYGDAWINDPIDAKIWLCWEKTQRAIYITKNNNNLKNDYESLEDTLKDLVNYAMFSLVILEKRKGGNNEKK